MDWDDTLFPSSWVIKNGITFFSDVTNFEQEFSKLENSIKNLLEKMISLGSVVIITNAEISWVRASANRFLPNIVPYLNNIPVISARENYEFLYPNDSFLWKKECFQNYITKIQSDRATFLNIYSIGDSHGERIALHAVQSENIKLRKSVKLIEHPELETLYYELDYLLSQIDNIHRCCDNMDVEVK